MENASIIGIYVYTHGYIEKERERGTIELRIDDDESAHNTRDPPPPVSSYARARCMLHVQRY